MTEAPDTGRDTAEFDFAGRTVTLFEPTTGQGMILIDVLDLNDPDIPDSQKVETVNLFSQMLRSLFTTDEDRRHVRGALARGEADVADFIGLAEQMAEHWMPAQANNRAERRAAKAAPASTRRPTKATAKKAATPRAR